MEKTNEPNFVMVDFGTWYGDVKGGLVRTVKGNIIIRIAEEYRNLPEQAGAIASELIARCKRLMDNEPCYQLWPIKISIKELPECNGTRQEGFDKLKVPLVMPDSLTYRLIE